MPNSYFLVQVLNRFNHSVFLYCGCLHVHTEYKHFSIYLYIFLIIKNSISFTYTHHLTISIWFFISLPNFDTDSKFPKDLKKYKEKKMFLSHLYKIYVINNLYLNTNNIYLFHQIRHLY